MRKQALKSTVAICLLALFIGAAAAQTQAFMDEIKAIRAKSKTADVEIHDIAAKYIPLGTRKEDAINFCEANKFKIYQVDKRDFDTKKYDEALYCSLQMTKWYIPLPGPGFKDEVRITMRIKDGVVVEIRGFIFYHAL